MPVKFIDAVRVNPAPCAHFSLTLELDDGSTRTHALTLEGLNGFLDAMAVEIGEGPRAREIALSLFWIGYQLDHGVTIAQMRDEIIVRPVP